MPQNDKLAQLQANPQDVLAAAMQAEIAALAGGNAPVQLPGLTLADIENEIRTRAQIQANRGDTTIMRTVESAIAMNRQFMQGVAKGLVNLQEQVDELRKGNPKPKAVENKSKTKR